MSPIIPGPGTLQRPDQSRNAAFMFPVAAALATYAFPSCLPCGTSAARARNDRDGAIMRRTRQTVKSAIVNVEFPQRGS